MYCSIVVKFQSLKKNLHYRERNQPGKSKDGIKKN
jgi:hypothetical protein